MALTGSTGLAILAGPLAGALFNMVFAFLVITRRANQLASGLALMFCGGGLSALIGGPYIGSPIAGLPEIRIPVLAEAPLVGTILFQQDVLVYAAVPVVVLAWWALFFTRWGLSLRAVGENPTAAFAAGKNPHALQYQALFIAGSSGDRRRAHLSLGPAKTWAEWDDGRTRLLAVALVISPSGSRAHDRRRPPVRRRDLAGAAAPVLGVPVSPFLLDMLPTCEALAVLAASGGARRSAAPGSLGRVISSTDCRWGPRLAPTPPKPRKRPGEAVAPSSLRFFHRL